MDAPKKRTSLFRSTAVTVASALIVLQLVIFSASVYYIILPMARRSTDDLAALMVLSAQTWAELPPLTRPDFELELARQHDLWLIRSKTSLPDYEHHIPYLMLLEDALQVRTGRVTRTKVTKFEKIWYWVEFSVGEHQISIGFPQNRLGMQSIVALLLIMLATIALTLVTAIILARRISHPLQNLAEAAKHIGLGNTPEKIAESGVEELDELAQTFNTMSKKVQELLSNRTTLLAGISHDLRTPLARMRLAIEMLPKNADTKIVNRLKHDIGEMNRMIGEFLSFSRGLEKEVAETVDMNELLQELVDNVSAEGVVVHWWPVGQCRRPIARMAVSRIITNLLSNAARYGGGKEIELRCECGDIVCVLHVLDRGPGIPADEVENVFRPFYRLESSRSTFTGGSGLGLAIAWQLAEANGWKIELLPRTGGGTEARLSIPHSK
ncbi:MAG: ATP-binding protein [Gallionellaceae bacterium]|jgi:two-component system osmolarity sensor histidine kinase EnvZ